jgi:hypothetical protein
VKQMLTEEKEKTGRTRREFLKQTLKTTGYIIPAVMVFKAGSTRSWAQSYQSTQESDQNTAADLNQRKRNSSDPCNGFFEKIFKTSCWKW